MSPFFSFFFFLFFISLFSLFLINFFFLERFYWIKSLADLHLFLCFRVVQGCDPLLLFKVESFFIEHLVLIIRNFIKVFFLISIYLLLLEFYTKSFYMIFVDLKINLARFIRFNIIFHTCTYTWSIPCIWFAVILSFLDSVACLDNCLCLLIVWFRTEWTNGV